MNEYKGIMPTKIELTLEQSQQGVSNDVLEVLPKLNLPDHRYKRWCCSLILAEFDSLPHAHTQTTKTYYKHQDSRIKKAQELKTKTSSNFDIKDNSSETKLRGRVLESFQDDAKYEHVGQDTRSQGGKDDQDKQGKDLKISDRRKPLELKVGDHVLLKVSPWKGVVRFGRKGKLAPLYVGPFEIVERVGPVAYRLRLPQELSCIHDTFHVSNLKKCLADASLQVPLEEVEIDDKFCFVEELIEILDREVKKLKQKWIPIFKVRWNSQRGAEFTSEQEVQFKAKYPHLFATSSAAVAS
ncbi:hypothetical protein Tco_0013903 [Tanacetum coccineum]